MKQKLSPLVIASLLSLFAGTHFAALGADGRAVFETQKCGLCHSVSSAGIEARTGSEKLKGPDLVDVRFGAQRTTRFLKQGTGKRSEGHSKPFKGSDEELQALVDWLLEQKAEG